MRSPLGRHCIKGHTPTGAGGDRTFLVLLEPLAHVSHMAPMATRLTPSEPRRELSKFVVRGGVTVVGTVARGGAHVNQADGAPR